MDSNQVFCCALCAEGNLHKCKRGLWSACFFLFVRSDFRLEFVSSVNVSRALRWSEFAGAYAVFKITHGLNLNCASNGVNAHSLDCFLQLKMKKRRFLV